MKNTSRYERKNIFRNSGAKVFLLQKQSIPAKQKYRPLSFHGGL